MTAKQYRTSAGALTLLATVAYTLGLTLPMTTIETVFAPFINNSDTYSLPTAIKELYRQDEWILATILVAFTFVFPATKLFSLFMGVLRGWTDGNNRLYRFMRATGRWSMLDVFVVAILVVLLRVEAMSGGVRMIPKLGIYCFGASVVLAMWAGNWAESANNHSRSATG